MHRFLFTLLCISVWLNYIDRGILGVAAPVIRPELGISATQMGLLLSAFFWTYSLLQPLAGYLVDRFDPYRLYAVAFAMWSVAAALGGFSNDFEALFATRLLLGIGESIAYPAYSRILATSVAEGRRGIANALIDVGTKAGPAAGTFLGGMAIASWGWRPFFIWLGLASLLWLIPWLRALPPKQVSQSSSASNAPALAILGRRDAWLTFFGLFCFNYAYYFLLTWLPSYLTVERKFTMKAMAVYGALPFCATAAASLAGAYWADRRIRAGAPAVPTRRGMAVTGLIIAASMLMASVQVEAQFAMVFLVLAFIGIGLFTCNAWAISQSLAGPSQAGTWTGFQNAVGNMGGVVAPMLTGWSVAATGNFFAAFAVAAAMLMLSAVFYTLLPSEAKR
ncbi:MAG: MFS transporter [Acidobacteria bacterium]|nr:MFS transporter [Acidobacteriota bacterium]